MTTWASRLLTFAAIASAFFASGNARRLAPRVEQQLTGRSTYLGGWPLAATTCPAEAPVMCDTNDGTVNPTCCPTGNTCFGLTAPYCCPTSEYISSLTLLLKPLSFFQ